MESSLQALPSPEGPKGVSQSAGAGAGMSALGGFGADGNELLLAGKGGEFVWNTLYTTETPEAAIEIVQSRASYPSPDTAPLLGLLDVLQVDRADAYKHVLDRALERLLARVPALPQEAVLALLEASFHFISLEELRPVPLAALQHLRDVPARFLKDLAVKAELFRQLPRDVQRQVWKTDAPLLRRHVSPALRAYADEGANIARELDMDLALAPWPDAEAGVAAAAAPAAAQQQLRRVLRSGSPSIKRLVSVLGGEGERQLYNTIVAMCRQHYGEHGAPSACSLRSQLLMALHDKDATSLTQSDSCHRLTWVLDACVKDRCIEPRRGKEIDQMIDQAAAIARHALGRGATAGQKRTKRDNDYDSDGGESVFRSDEGEAAAAVLGDVGMILRDPQVLHLLLHEVVRTLELVVEQQAVPKNDPHLCTLTKAITLALRAQSMIQEKQFSMPQVNKQVLTEFFPKLADVIIEAELRDSDDEDEEEAGEEVGEQDKVDPQLVTLMTMSAVVRKVTLTFVLRRLADGDVSSARPLLMAVADVLKNTQEFLQDDAPFAVTLARRLSSMSAAGRLPPDGPLWGAAVEGVLLPACAISMEVHEEVLKLLQQVAPGLEPAQLGKLLERTLVVTRKTRKHYKKRRVVVHYEYDEPTDVPPPAPDAPPGGEVVRQLYVAFSQQQHGLVDAEHAPGLFEYVRKHEKEK